MGAQAHEVLHKKFIVRVLVRIVAIELQAEAAELAVAVVDHGAVPPWGETLIAETACSQHCGIGAVIVGIELVVTQAGAPPVNELIHALRIPTALPPV